MDEGMKQVKQPQFTHEEMEAQQFSNLPKVPQIDKSGEQPPHNLTPQGVFSALPPAAVGCRILAEGENTGMQTKGLH